MSNSQPKLPPIVHSCYFASSSRGEQFTSVHTFSYQEAGKIVANDGTKEYVFDEGEFRFTVGKKLAKYYKIPPPNGAFKSIAIFFDEEMLREMSAIHGFTATQKPGSDIFLRLTPHQAYKDLFNSLIPYLDADQTLDKELLNLKAREALLIIMKVNPELKDILFDFSKPGKIDLETFMQKNYHFKVSLERFAFLTGRSLATFKRDFEKIFNISPSRWLTQRRLQQAYYLIKEMGKRPSEIYVDLGFEDFSHFTYAFRQLYGASPTKI